MGERGRDKSYTPRSQNENDLFTSSSPVTDK